MANIIDTDAKVIGETQLGFGQQHVLAVSTTLYAAHITDTNDIEVHKSTDAGVNWTLDTTFSSLTNPISLSLCASELGDLFLGFVHDTSFVIVKKKDYLTGVWSQVYNTSHLSEDPVGQHNLVIYSRTQARLYLLYNSGDANVYNKRSDDYGATWSAATKTTGGSSIGGSMFLYSACPASNSNMYAFMGSIAIGIKTVINNSNGTQIGTEGVISSTLSDFYGGELAIDSSSNRWRIWYYLSGGIYYLNVDKNAVNSISINYGAVNTILKGMFSIGVDGIDNVYIFYTKRTDNKSYYRMYTASTLTWGSEQLLTASDGLRPSCEQRSLGSSHKLNIVYYTN